MVQRSTRIILFLAFLLPISARAAENSGAMSFAFTTHDFRSIGMGLKQTIYADGDITPGTASRLQSFIEQNQISSYAVVSFNSRGGNLREGLAIGRLIRKHKLQTDVSFHTKDNFGSSNGAVCYSACTISFLGGVIRYVPTEARFGVHRFSSKNSNLTGAEALDFSQVQMSKIVEYVDFMGIKPGFIGEMSLAAPTDLNMLNQETLKMLRVITPQRETTWEIKSTPAGDIYVLGSTVDIRGTHKILFICPTKRSEGAFIKFMFDAGGENSFVSATISTALRINEDMIALQKADIIFGPAVNQDYVSVLVRLSRQNFAKIKNGDVLGVAMLHRNGATFVGFDADFSEGKSKALSYLKPCIH